MKEYQAIVWLAGDDATPGKRVTFMAEDATSAGAVLEAEYGPDAVYTCWNDEDADRPR